MTYDSGLNATISKFPLILREANDESNYKQQAMRQNDMLMPYKMQSAQFDQQMQPLKMQGAQSDLETAKLKQAKEKLDMVGTLVGSVVDQGSYDRALMQAKSMGLDVSQFGPTYNPAQITQMRNNLATANAQLSAMMQQKQIDQRYALGTMGGGLPAATDNPMVSPAMPAPAAMPAMPAPMQNGLVNPGFMPRPPDDAPLGAPLTDEIASNLPPAVAAGPALSPPSAPPAASLSGGAPMPFKNEPTKSYLARVEAWKAEKANNLPFQEQLSNVKQKGQKDADIAAAKPEETAKLEAKLALEPTLEREKAKEGASGKFEGEKLKREFQANNVLDLLHEAKTILPKATGSMMGAGVAAAKGAAGVSDESTKANRRLELISGWLTSNVPRMEGPQSDFDVDNYKKMAGDLGNKSIPIGDRLATLDQLQQLESKYAQFNPNRTTTQSAPSTPAIAAPSGWTVKRMK